MNIFFAIIRTLFLFTLFCFVAGGMLIVAVQTAGLIGMQPGWVTDIYEQFSPWVFSASSICAILAFVLKFRPHPEHHHHHRNGEHGTHEHES